MSGGYDDDKIGHVSVEDGHAVIRIPKEHVHGVRVALKPCPCKSPKSRATAEVRERIAKALGYAEVKL